MISFGKCETNKFSNSYFEYLPHLLNRQFTVANRTFGQGSFALTAPEPDYLLTCSIPKPLDKLKSGKRCQKAATKFDEDIQEIK